MVFELNTGLEPALAKELDFEFSEILNKIIVFIDFESKNQVFSSRDIKKSIVKPFGEEISIFYLVNH